MRVSEIITGQKNTIIDCKSVNPRIKEKERLEK